jgi:hypothetical protein
MIMMQRSFISSESAVSESIGYLLILGIMIFSIGIIFVVGYPALQNSMDDAHMQNMERGFIVMGKSIDRVAEQEAPTQSVELNLKGGTLTTYNTASISIIYTYTNDTATLPRTWGITTVTYKYHGDKQIGYEFGGVFENIGQEGYVLKDPQMISSQTFIIPIVNVYSSGTAIGGDGLAKALIYGGESTLTPYSDIKKINITVTSNYYKGWEKYLKKLGMDTHDDSSGTVYGEMDATKFSALFGVNKVNVTEVNKPILIEII